MADKHFYADDIANNGINFNSEAIETLAYARTTKELFIEFVSGGKYVYEGVNESTYNLFKEADSLGGFYRTHIMGEFESTSGNWEVVGRTTPTPEREVVPERKPEPATAPSDKRKYGVRWVAGDTSIGGEPVYFANSEEEALKGFWMDVETFMGDATTDHPIKITAVVRYFG
jgi:hypothetical protein